jgi:hypothetical protein
MPVAPVGRTTPIALEARSGLDPWVRADLPAPPTPTGMGWLGRRARRDRTGRLDWERGARRHRMRRTRYQRPA